MLQQPRTTRPEPWAQIRGSRVGRKATSNARRITSGSMSTCTIKTSCEADLISRQIFRAMRLGRGRKLLSQLRF